MKAGPRPQSDSQIRSRSSRLGSVILRTATKTANLLLPTLLSGCVYALRPYNPPSQQSLHVVTTSPERYLVRVAEKQNYPVASNGHVTFDVPPLPRGCAVYLFGVMKIADARSEDVQAIQLVRDGTVMRKLSLRQIDKLPADGDGYHSIILSALLTSPRPPRWH
jgi:hypothetical protein